jgi:glutamine amidotransferase
MRARRIAVIDYGTGNLKSVVKAFEYLGANVSLTRKPEDVGEIDAIVFPGQGSYDQCMNCLMQSGLDHLVKKWVQQDRPFFGICLGLQVLFESSEEGKLPGLGLFQGHVRRFVLPPELKIPHMGWNDVYWNLPEDHWICKNLEEPSQFYFVHSYKVITEDPRLTKFHTSYGETFTSGISYSNCLATQFHPEKSQSKGIQLYRNFLENIG